MPSLPTDIRVDRDGRSLSVRLAGAAAGPLVLYVHGSPSSRVDVEYLHESSTRRGVRVAAIDRPGYGHSTFMPFTFRSVAADAAAVADHLAAETFAVYGFSTGVAHGAALAAEFPERVTALATAGGGAPFEAGTPRWSRLSEGERRGLALVGTDDAEASRLLAEPDRQFVGMLELDDEAIAAAWAAASHPADARAFTGELGRIIGPSMREALRQGQLGWARDNVVWMARWDFDLKAIRCPTTIWLGDEDGAGTLEGGRWLADQIPHAELRVIPDRGHLIGFELWDEVLDSLNV
ncbi:MAG TPA: alpha/beta hydrolase [Candidatus Limnocylindrales bacterium]|nr:alpha/beta hydrolase [Candidatus Limnocylindrales bacterium]